VTEFRLLCCYFCCLLLGLIRTKALTLPKRIYLHNFVLSSQLRNKLHLKLTHVVDYHHSLGIYSVAFSKLYKCQFSFYYIIS